FLAHDEILQAGRKSDLVICDRYVASNLAYQGAKLPVTEWARFFGWVYNLEFGAYQLPRPDLSIYLDMPVKTARRLVSLKRPGSSPALTEALHERDEPYTTPCAKPSPPPTAPAIAGPWAVVPCADAAGAPPPADEIAGAVWDVYSARRRRILPA